MSTRPDPSSTWKRTTVRTASCVLAAPLLVTLFLETMGCGAGSAASVLRPSEMTAAEAIGENGQQCAASAEPLVVDWAAHQRANLEEAMHDGVAVVAYDCKTLRLLKDCRLQGSYEFMSISKKEEEVRFENADEVSASMPGFGIPLVKSIDADFSRGSTIDLAMVLVGKRRTTVRTASAAELVGAEACAGATHFVRGALVGAFSMGTGTRGQAHLGAQLLDASSTSTRSRKYRDGDASKCEQAKDDQAATECNSLLRLELSALRSSPKASAQPSSPSSEGVMSCPVGLVATAGKCATAAPGMVHQCKLGDASDCTTQCERGDPISCQFLGYMFYKGEGVGRDPSRGLTLSKRGCTLGDARSCNNAGYMYRRGDGAAKDLRLAFSYLDQACSRGDAWGCVQFGIAEEIENRNLPRAGALYEKGCRGGEALGCANLASFYDRGLGGLARDEAKGAELSRRACEGAIANACVNLGIVRARSRDFAATRALFQKACALEWGVGCTQLGTLYENASGVPADLAKARSLYEEGCRKADAVGCTAAGKSHYAGRGVPSDHATALSFYRKSCDVAKQPPGPGDIPAGGWAEGCGNLGQMLWEGDTVPANKALALEAFRTGCADPDPNSAKYRDMACGAVQKLGGTP